MKILLVKPPSATHLVIPPIGLAYLAASCDGHSVTILDCLKEKYDFHLFAEHISTTKPDILGLTAFSLEIDAAIQCANIGKSINNKLITVIGGVHASNRPEEVLSSRNVDFIVTGEAEKSFPLFLKAASGELSYEEVPGLGYRNDSDTIVINKSEDYPDIDEIQAPRYDLLKLTEYPKTYQSKRFPVAPVITSRGCPFSCSFCSGHSVSGRKFRARSATHVVEEMRMLYNLYGIKEISIYDDNFTLNKKRVIDICSRLIDLDMDLTWNLPNGISLKTIDRDVLKLMKKAGCYEICIGIESCSDRILKDMKKEITVDIIRKKVPLIAETGMQSTGFFILGYPTETIEDMKQTIKISRKLKLHRARYFIFQPLPGSAIFDDLISQNILQENFDWSKVDYSKVQVLPKSIKNVGIIQRLQRNAILSFYLRPHIFLRYLRDNLSLDQLKELMSMVRIYILHK